MSESLFPFRSSAWLARDFPTTDWKTLLRSRSGDEAGRAHSLNRLCLAYWSPLYHFVRRAGYSSHDAKDLVQEFFQGLLSRDSLAGVDQARGKFRSFLIASLRHHLLNDLKRQRRLKRGGRNPALALEETAIARELPAAPAADQTAALSFDRQWAQTVMALASKRLKAEQTPEQSGRHQVLGVFLSREVSTGEYERLARELGMSPQAVKSAVHRLRRRFAELVREEVARTVTTRREIDEELRYLFSLLRE